MSSQRQSKPKAMKTTNLNYQRFGNYTGKHGLWNYETGIYNMKYRKAKNPVAFKKAMNYFHLTDSDKDIERYVAENSDHTLFVHIMNRF